MSLNKIDMKVIVTANTVSHTTTHSHTHTPTITIQEKQSTIVGCGRLVKEL